jgi:hypothetical protein
MEEFKVESREETVARYRERFIKKFEERAFNFKEALCEFDKDPESFNMVFYTLADVVIEKLKEHPYSKNIEPCKFDPYNYNCDEWGWFCKPGEYPSIKF